MRHLCAVPPRGAVDDGSARHVLRQYLVNVVELRRAAGRHHHEVQVGAPGAAVEDPELNAQLFFEIIDEFVLHVGLGGGSQAQDRRHRIVSRLLADEASHVTVIGPEVVAPPREAVGLVQHPGPAAGTRSAVAPVR